MAKDLFFSSFFSGYRNYDSGFIHCTSPVEQTQAIEMLLCAPHTTCFCQSMKGYCFFVPPLLHCLYSFWWFFFVMPGLLSNRNKTACGGVVHEDGTALQYMMLMRLFTGISSFNYQRSQDNGPVCPPHACKHGRGEQKATTWDKVLLPESGEITPNLTQNQLEHYFLCSLITGQLSFTRCVVGHSRHALNYVTRPASHTL